MDKEQDGFSKFTIAQAQERHLERIMKIYERARKFMAEHGNPNQWPPSYPPRDQVEEDIREGHMFLCMADMYSLSCSVSSLICRLILALGLNRVNRIPFIFTPGLQYFCTLLTVSLS